MNPVHLLTRFCGFNCGTRVQLWMLMSALFLYFFLTCGGPLAQCEPGSPGRFSSRPQSKLVVSSVSGGWIVIVMLSSFSRAGLPLSPCSWEGRIREESRELRRSDGLGRLFLRVAHCFPGFLESPPPPCETCEANTENTQTNRDREIISEVTIGFRIFEVRRWKLVL